MWKPSLPASASEPVFRFIVQAIADDVAAGRLAPGERLPPHRDLAHELAVARGTVARAYREAERLGLVRSEVGRGTRIREPDDGVRRYASLLEPPTVSSDATAQIGDASLDPDPAAALKHLAARPDRKALLRYHPPVGLERHRTAGARWLQRLGVRCSAEEVVLCGGAQPALFASIAHLAQQSRTLYVEELTYPGMHGIAEATGVVLVPIAVDAEGMQPASLARAVARHGPGIVYCMPTLHNPLGAVMSSKRRAAIAEIARKRRSFLIEDAANRMLLSKPPPSLRDHAPERTFLIASVSKVLSPGLRVAFVVPPAGERRALVRRLWAMQWMPPPLGAELVAMWMEDGTLEATLQRKRSEARHGQRIARRILGERAVVAHAHALHLWWLLPRRTVVDALLSEARRQQLVVTPAAAFWTRTTPPPAAVRVSLASGGGELGRKLARLADVVTYGARP